MNNLLKINLVGMPYNFNKLLKNETFCGHLNYSPPEMLKVENKGAISEKVDIWALGCCLYFLSSKKDPFHGPTHDKVK